MHTQMKSSGSKKQSKVSDYFKKKTQETTNNTANAGSHGHDELLQPAEPGSIGENEPMDSSNSQTLTAKTEPLETLVMRLAEHATHSFHCRFSYDGCKKYKISCSSPGTVLRALQQNKRFKKETKGKGIIIERKEHKVIIATHFPCCLIKKNELLTINTIPTRRGEMDANHIMERKRLVTFYVLTKGGKGCKTKKLLNNNEFKRFSKLCIYAYEGETVEAALRRDGRFADIVFRKQCELFDTTSNVHIEMSSSVDELNGSHFEIILTNEDRNSQQENFTNLGEGATNAASSSGVTVQAGPSQNPPQSLSNPDKAAAEKPSPTPKNTYKPIADSEEVLKILRSQFDGLVKLMKERENVKTLPKVLDLLREEFGKNTQVFWKVSQMKKLVELSESVCQICINGTAVATGFLLFDGFILTNAHVLKDRCAVDGSLTATVTVIFTTVDASEQAQSHKHGVEGIVCGSYNLDAQKNPNVYLDYVLLRIRSETTNLPLGLLEKYRPPPPRGGICIIGYPEDSEQRIDLSSIIETKQRDAAVERHKNENICFLQSINAVWKKDCNTDIVGQDSNVVTYDTCFFHGSSGSPVFGEDCQLIAMHTGGYFYKPDKSRSVIEYAIPLSSILENFLLEMLNKQNLTILSAFTVKAMICDALRSLIARFITYIVQSWKAEFETCLSTVLFAVKGSDENVQLQLGMEIIKVMESQSACGDWKTCFNQHQNVPEGSSLVTLHQFLCNSSVRTKQKEELYSPISKGKAG